MKQITIYDLLPFMRNGWVAMDECGAWFWHKCRAKRGYDVDCGGVWFADKGFCCELPTCFNIAPFDGDWKDSLIKVEHSKKKSTDRKDFDDFIEQHGVSPWGFLTEAILKEDFECWKKRRKNEKERTTRN